jgi:hypothetical protein
MGKWGIVAVVFAATACSRGQTPQPISNEAANPVAIDQESGPIDAAPRELVYQSHGATFEKERLDECVDVEIRVTPPSDAGVDWAPTKDPAANFFGGAKAKITTLKKACADQFADRTVLATCTVAKTNVSDAGTGQTARIRLVSTYYDFGLAVESDGYMQQCLSMGADWKAVPRDSDAFKRAKLDYDAANLRKLTGKLSEVR